MMPSSTEPDPLFGSWRKIVFQFSITHIIEKLTILSISSCLGELD